jgi:ABC-type sugar transport system substrate-binding protein
MGRTHLSRIKRVLLAVGLLTAVLAIPAAATPDDGDGHTVTICHVTNSETNEFTVITVDVAAFDGEGANDHTHHVNKFGNSDILYVEGVPCGPTATTTTTSTTMPQD